VVRTRTLRAPPVVPGVVLMTGLAAIGLLIGGRGAIR